ncbi:MAG: hypothetical protein NC191_05055 [Muribaculaceae bacterium]|nr:hypothetical protein [Muribaculaceae bacterium]
MKLDKVEKIVISAVALLIILTIIVKNHHDRQARIFGPVPIYINSTEDKELPKNIRELSKKYHAYEDLYKSDDLTLVYSYYTDGTKTDRNQEFHNELTQKLEESGIKINTVTFKNWEDDTLEISLKNKEFIDETATCAPEEKEELLLKKYIEDAQLCINNVCLVNVKKHKYSLMSPEVDYVVETIKEYSSKR